MNVFDDESDLSDLEEGGTPPPPPPLLPPSEDLTRVAESATEGHLNEPPSIGLSTNISFPRDQKIDTCRGWCQCEKGCAWAEKTPAHLNSVAIDSMPVPLSSERSTQLPARTTNKGMAPPLLDEETRELARSGKFDDRGAWAMSKEAMRLTIELGCTTSIEKLVGAHEMHVKKFIHMFNANFPPAYEELRMLKLKGESMYGTQPKMEQLCRLLTTMLNERMNGKDLDKVGHCNSFADITDGHPELVMQFRSLAFPMKQDGSPVFTGKSDTYNEQKQKQWIAQQQQQYEEQQAWQDWRGRLPFTDSNRPEQGNLTLDERYKIRQTYAERLINAIEATEPSD